MLDNEEEDKEAFEKLCARLIRPPFLLSIEQIKHLTPYQVRNIIYRKDEPKSSNMNDLMALAALVRH